MDIDLPRSLRNPREQQRRRSMLSLPHIAPLTTYVEGLRGLRDWFVPEFDPLDGGVQAEVPILFEKPGPATETSGFISRNNDDASAAAVFQFMSDVSLPRTRTVTWNLIPGWNRSIPHTASERKFGLDCLPPLLALLQHLEVVILAGGTAHKAAPYFLALGLPVIRSWHTSPKVRAFSPDKWAAIPEQWQEVWRYIPTQTES
jgi:hypothetical protein